MKLIIVALIGLLGACSSDEPEFIDQCLRSHEEAGLLPVPVMIDATQVTIVNQPYVEVICDEAIRVKNPKFKGEL